MTGRRLIGLAFVALLFALLLAPGAGGRTALSPPSAACNGGGCSDGWYRESVTVSWNVDPTGLTSAPCGSTTISDDTGGQQVACTVTYGTVTVSNYVVVKKDSTPPGVTASLERSPDSNGWYTKPVAVNVSGEDGASGIAGCDSGTYGGPDGRDLSVSGTCRDNAGNSSSGSVRLSYDATAPSVTGAPSRQPDANGWYNHAVQVGFTGSDGGSGIAECTAPVTYKGPDANPVRMTGQCRDAAGHVSAPTTVELRYDGTAPGRPKVTTALRGRRVALTWTTARDVVAVEVVRAPGPRGRKAGVVFRGKGNRLLDRTTKNNVRYWYEVKAYDEAGNVASTTVSSKLLTGVYSPLPGSVVRAPPLVAWTPVRGARFYNVQLWLGREKILTTWPTAPRLQLTPTWTFGGKRRQLVNGDYRIYVWPAFGSRAQPQYGKRLAETGFRVRRR